jgi:hypothetical protein
MAIIPDIPAIRQGLTPSVGSNYLKVDRKPMILAVDSGEKRLILKH